ncbi:MAG TPA: TetR family transcriptional regulator [Puia sp.]|nr:TetR family transcriptional regulator [Puia sp.]
MTDKRDHIIEKAIELFASKGFEGTSIRDLAAAADVNVAMINYYFGSKEKLFEVLVEKKAAYTRGIMDEIANDKTLSSIQKIERIIESYVERLFTNRKFHRVINQELITNQRETLTRIIADALFPNALTIKTIIEEGIKKNEFKKVDPQLTIATLLGTINQVLLSKMFCLRLLNKGPEYVPYDDPEFRKRVVDFLKQLMRDHLLK